MDHLLSETNGDLVLIFPVNNGGSPGLFQNVNELACKILGYSRADLLNLSPVDLVDNPDAYEEFLHYINESFAQRPEALRTRLVAKDGTQIPVELKIQSFDINGQSGRVLKARKIEADTGVSHLFENSPKEILDRNQLSKQLGESQTLLEISQMLASASDLPTILQEIATAAQSLIKQADMAVLHLLNEDGTILEPAAIAGTDLDFPRTRLNFKPGEGLAGQAIITGKAINSKDASSDPRYILRDGSVDALHSLLVVPVKTEMNILGSLSVQSPKIGVFSVDDERLLTILSSHAAVAIQKAQLLKTERDHRQLAEALRNISQDLSRTLDSNTILGKLLDHIRSVIPFDAADVLIVDQKIVRAIRVAGYEKFGEEVTRQAAQYSAEIEQIPVLRAMTETCQPMIIPDTKSQPVTISSGKMPAMLSWAGVPIIAQNNVIAFVTLHIHDPATGYYRQDQADLLSAFTGQVSLALENARLFENTQRRLKEVDIMYRVSQGIAASLEIDTVLKRLVNLVQEAFGYYNVHVFLLDPESGDLVLRQASGRIGNALRQMGFRIPAGEGIMGHSVTTGKPFLANDVATTPFYISNPLLPKTRSELALPLRIGKHILGVLDIQSDALYAFTEQDLYLLRTIADQVAIAVQKGMLYADLQASLQQEQATRLHLVQAEKLSSLGRIIASVAHELNNPLQTIHNLIYLVKKEENLSSQAQEDLQTSLDEADRMAGLIARLKDIYRPANQEQFQLETVNTLITEVQALIRTHLRHNNIEFIFNEDPSTPIIPMIRDQIKQVVLNVCLNAVETMPDGGKLVVTTSNIPESHEVLLSFEDTGPGIPEAILPNIFDPFVTTKENGTGLGLAITYDIINRHRGRIDVKNAPTQGTVFEIWLPITR
jgi:PAS domain S-box-containing protein